MASRIINMTIPEKLIDEVDEIARKEGRTRSELFREAIRLYVGKLSSGGKNASPLLSRLASLSSKGPDISASQIDGIIYAKKRSGETRNPG